jgi:hypothetical protein
MSKMQRYLDSKLPSYQAINVRYHYGGSMILKACISHLAHVVFFKHNYFISTTYTQLARYVQDWHYIGAHGTIPFDNPLTIPLDNPPLLEESLPCPRVSLTYLESLLCVWYNSRPLWSQVASILTSPFPPHSLFPLPNGSPLQLCALLRWHHDIDFT